MTPTTNLFFLLISPPQKVIEYVSYLKKLIYKYIGRSYDSLHSIAHLSLLQYYDLHNESQLYILGDRAAHIKSFNIFIKDFNAFNSNGTIYLDIVNKYSVDGIARMLTGCSIMPHITIARNLKQEELNVVKKNFKELSFSHWFTCDHIDVLKRVNHRWLPHEKLYLSTRDNRALIVDDQFTQA